ncbi:hypothetical protein BKN49_05725 [Pseudomonas aeruginosa]|nr:hypothetical protein BKN49_05725 [Pseudomonas aeruginosa]
MDAGKLNWSGFASLPIPAIVKQGCQDPEIEIHFGDLQELPYPLNSASCWIYCLEAWPHQDPDFHRQSFITLAIQGDHRYGQLVPGDQFKEVAVFPGTLLTTDPMAMHWLAPNSPDNNPGFIGLQWEVKRGNLDAKLDELKAALTELGQVNGCAIKATPAVLSQPEPLDDDPLV